MTYKVNCDDNYVSVFKDNIQIDSVILNSALESVIINDKYILYKSDMNQYIISIDDKLHYINNFIYDIDTIQIIERDKNIYLIYTITTSNTITTNNTVPLIFGYNGNTYNQILGFDPDYIRFEYIDNDQISKIELRFYYAQYYMTYNLEFKLVESYDCSKDFTILKEIQQYQSVELTLPINTADRYNVYTYADKFFICEYLEQNFMPNIFMIDNMIGLSEIERKLKEARKKITPKKYILSKSI